MFVTHLSVTDFRNYAAAELDLVAGVNVFVGSNGQGKTNLVEAIEYLSTMSSHRVSATAPLIRAGAESAILRGRVQASRDDERLITLELEVANGRSNIARLNRAPLPRPRDLVGALRTVVFSPMDLAIVRGDPSDRRAWLDTLVTTRWPRMAGVRADLDKILRQRNSLLKAMSGKSLRHSTPEEDVTLQAWNDALARIGAELLHARLDTLADVLPHAAGAYETIAPVNNRISALYKTSLDLAGIPVDAVRETLEARLLDAMTERRREEVARGVTLVGPQRDDITLSIGELPAKGYASHGESWSLALALKLGGFALVRSDGIEPVLVLDDVFSELDAIRRERLAGAVADAEQVLITAAVFAGLYWADKGLSIPFITGETADQTIARIITVGGGVCLLVVGLSLAVAALRDRSAGWLTTLSVIGIIMAFPTAAIGTQAARPTDFHINVRPGIVGTQTTRDWTVDRVSGGNPAGTTVLDLSGAPVGTTKTIVVDWEAWSSLTIQVAEGQPVQIVCQSDIETLSTNMDGDGWASALKNCSGVTASSPSWGKPSLGGITVLIADDGNIDTLTILQTPDSSGTWSSKPTTTPSATPSATPSTTPSTTPSPTPTGSQSGN